MVHYCCLSQPASPARKIQLVPIRAPDGSGSTIPRSSVPRTRLLWLFRPVRTPPIRCNFFSSHPSELIHLGVKYMVIVLRDYPLSGQRMLSSHVQRSHRPDERPRVCLLYLWLRNMLSWWRRGRRWLRLLLYLFNCQRLGLWSLKCHVLPSLSPLELLLDQWFLLSHVLVKTQPLLQPQEISLVTTGYPDFMQIHNT